MPNTTNENACWKVPNSGLLVVFEGIDRSGKSSQAKLLYERLEKLGLKCKLLRFPDRTTPIGKLLNEILSRKAEDQPSAHLLHLIFAANRWESEPIIRKALREGYIVISDRYSFSGVAYSTTAANRISQSISKDSEFYPLTPDFAKNTETGLPCPDVVFFLDVTPESAQKRSGYGDEVYESLSLQQDIYNGYTRFFDLPYWHKVSCPSESSIESINDDIYNKVMKICSEKQDNTPIKRLEHF